jgi:uncharacterized protein involved in exopolysaccharide biosynthesis
VAIWTASGWLPPSYRATAQVLLEQDQVQLGKIADVMKAPVLADSANISNEIAILLSTPVLQGAARRLGMLDADGRPVGAAAELAGRRLPIQRLLRSVGLPEAEAPLPLGPEAERQQGAARVTDAMRASLKVTRNLNALVIEVVASAADPVSAAAIANAVVEEYLSRQGRMKRQVADQALAWMNGEIGDLRARIGELNRRAQAERRQLLGAEAADPATTENQLKAVGNALALARTDRADAEARLGELRSALERLGVEAAGQLIDTPEIANVRRQLADLGQRLAAERASRGESRPVVAEMQAQIASLSDFARTLVERERERLDLDLRIRTERVEALQRESRELQRDALSLEQAQAAIAAIERETAANQELYVVLLTRLNEIAAQKEAIAPDARVLNAAVPPELPAGPRRGLLAALAGVVGLVGFTASVLAVDALSGRFESLGELEEATGLTVLGAVGRRAATSSRRVVDRDIGPLPAEDGIELAIILRGTGALPRLVVLVPAEATADAEALALRIVASADRRDRSIEVISLEPDAGTEGGPGLFRTMPLAVQMAAEQDGGAKASAQIRASCAHCDAVLLILPPVAETALIAAWARQADSTIVVVGGRRPAQAPTLRTVTRLRDAGVLPAGIVAVAD